MMANSELDTHLILLSAWRAVLGSKPVVYLSGPITTGPRFLDWYRRRSTGQADRSSNAYQESLTNEVILPNERDILSAAEELRRRTSHAVIEPASLRVPGWSQADYLRLWESFIGQFAGSLVMMPGWEYSSGSAHEFLFATKQNLPVFALDGHSIPPEEGASLLNAAQREITHAGSPIDIASVVKALAPDVYISRDEHLGVLRKDQSLDLLAEWINVAQFVSYSPDAVPHQEFCRIYGFSPNHRFPDVRSALENLLENSPEKSINIRSFTPEDPRSREFIYGIKSVEDAHSALSRLSAEGLYTIANETVDVRDGGVSGVAMGDVIEFSPDDTPRAVEKAGVASLPRALAMALLSTVYRLTPELNSPSASRLEFSIHPSRRGWRHSHTIAWEYEPKRLDGIAPQIAWPNNFSRMLGDKAFGLLIAHHLGLPTPRTTVISRRVAPFTFGTDTGSSEIWTRTSPAEPLPGKYTTSPGWIDPFALLSVEDPANNSIASILCQSSVRGVFSGAAITEANLNITIEGLSGSGLLFMQGLAPPEKLPTHIAEEVAGLARAAQDLLGPIRFEWVHDGHQAWIVQLHKGSTVTDGFYIVPGDADDWVRFDSRDGLPSLRRLLATLADNHGVEVVGDIGVTSHVADVLRKAMVPSRLRTTNSARFS